LEGSYSSLACKGRDTFAFLAARTSENLRKGTPSTFTDDMTGFIQLGECMQILIGTTVYALRKDGQYVCVRPPEKTECFYIGSDEFRKTRALDDEPIP
jgi:hypothetical protein